MRCRAADGLDLVTGNFGLTEFGTLIENEDYPKLADYLHTALPGTKFISVGLKSYAIDSATAPSGDIGVRMSSRGAAAACPLLAGAGAGRPGRTSRPTSPSRCAAGST